MCVRTWLGWVVVVALAVGCDARSHEPDDGGIIPTTCVSSRACADRLDCEDGERCNTALAEPVCQQIRCGAEGTACSESELCVSDLSCVGGVCSTAIDWVAMCTSVCETSLRDGCAEPGTDCDANCADAQTQYEQVQAIGCGDEFDALFACAADDPCNAECDAQATTLFECFQAHCQANPEDPICNM